MKKQPKSNQLVQTKRLVGFLSNKYYHLMAVALSSVTLSMPSYAASDAAKKVEGALDDFTNIGKAIYRFFPVLIVLGGAYGLYWGVMEFMRGVKTDNREGNKAKGAIVALVGVVAMAWTFWSADLASIITQGQSGGVKGVKELDIGL